jgi:alpha/beta superfamily hydrolase
MAAKLLERAVAIARADARTALEGIFLAGADDVTRGAVVAPPHPLYGGSMESPVVSELAYACAGAGLASLRFNWRGVGASAGAPSGELEDAEADVGAALTHLAGTLPGPLVAAGYSFGAAAAARAALRHRRVQRLLLVAPPPALLDPVALGSFAGATLLVAGSLDGVAPTHALESLAARLPRAELRVVPDADHVFAAALAELGRIAADWLAPRR